MKSRDTNITSPADSSSGIAAISDSLAGIRTALESDGYSLHLQLKDSEVLVRIKAEDSACEECLIPKQLMHSMISSALSDPETTVVLTYPADNH